MNEINSSSLILQMRAMAARAQNLEAQVTQAPESTRETGFASLLSDAVNKVNETQMQAGALSKAFEQGDPSVDLAEVMIAMQKASLSFQATTQVRNRLVSAYQDIMNMPL